MDGSDGITPRLAHPIETKKAKGRLQEVEDKQHPQYLSWTARIKTYGKSNRTPIHRDQGDGTSEETAEHQRTKCI